MDFFKNCVFIDRVDFHINMKVSRAWALRGKMTVAIIPTTKAPTHAIIGAISFIGVVNLSIRVPKQQPKVRKIQGGIKKKTPKRLLEKKDPKGTTAGHYLRFLSETLGIMVKHDQMKDYYQIMDNAPVYLSK
jgi:hypothetical protein